MEGGQGFEARRTGIRQLQANDPVVVVAARPPHEAGRFGPVDETDGAVVPQQEVVRYFADRVGSRIGTDVRLSGQLGRLSAVSLLDFSLVLFAICVGAGLLGSLLGLGGGVVVVPVLTLLFHVDIRLAVGASVISVIATSSGAAAAYVR